jgi:uncharacterized membrane protein
MTGSELPGAFFGLISAAGWGSGDFCGGLAARRSRVYGVVFVSQSVGLLLLAALALLLSEPVPDPGDLLLAGLAGIVGVGGLVALYRGLAVGRMGMVAPVSAVVSAVVPLGFGLFLEGLPSVQQMLGFAIALFAVWFISSTRDGRRSELRELGLPALAGLGLGTFLIVIARASEVSILWPLVAARTTSVAILLLLMALTSRRERPPAGRLPLMALAGLLDTGGNAFYALAAQVGRLDMAAVLSSLYPAVTVLLAWIVLKEQLTGRQWAGVASAIVAVVLIAS